MLIIHVFLKYLFCSVRTLAMCVWRCLAGGWAIRSRGDKSPQKPSIQTFPNQSCQRQTVPKERCEKDVKSKNDIKIIELNFMIIQHKVLWTIGTRGLHSIARHGGDKKIDSEEKHKHFDMPSSETIWKVPLIPSSTQGTPVGGGDFWRGPELLENERQGTRRRDMQVGLVAKVPNTKQTIWINTNSRSHYKSQ